MATAILSEANGLALDSSPFGLRMTFDRGGMLRLNKAFFLPILLGFVCGSALAEESLSSFQQDVVLAKEKHQAIVGKLDSARLALKTQESKIAVKETNRLVEAVVTESESANSPVSRTVVKDTSAVPAEGVVTVFPVSNKQASTVAPQQTQVINQTFPGPEERKSWRWPTFNNLFSGKKKLQNEPRGGSSYGNSIFEDGEALYRAAIKDNKVTIDEAVEIGLANNTKLQAARKNVEVADAKLTETKRALFPTVQGVVEINGGKVAGVVQGETVQRFYRGGNQKINFSQPLYNAGELANTVKQGEESVRVAKAEYKKAKDDIIHQIRVAYYGVVKAEYNTEYQIELFEKILEIIKKVRRQKEERVVAEVDYLNVESQYYQALYQVESSKNDVLSANVSLKQSLNLDMAGAIPVDFKMNFVKVKPTFEELLNRAIQTNADIRVKAFGLEVARYGVDIYEAKKKPHFELRGSYGMIGENFHDTAALKRLVDGKDANIDQEKEWYLGVHGSMPLGPNSVEYEQTKHVYGPTVISLSGSEDWKHHMAFNLWDKFNLITDQKQAEYSLLQAESDYKTVVDEVTLKLRDDFYSLQRYLIQIDSSTAKLRFQNKQIKILEYLLSLQETNPSNYVENLMAQVQDRYAFIQAVADYNVALSSVGLLIGDPYYFENQRLISPERYEASEIAEA